MKNGFTTAFFRAEAQIASRGLSTDHLRAASLTAQLYGREQLVSPFDQG